MPKPWQFISAPFASNVKSVYELLDFDRIIIDVAVDGLRGLAKELEDRHQLHNAVTLVSNRAAALENIKSADSLRPQYETMFNQGVVLVVARPRRGRSWCRTSVQLFPVRNEVLSVCRESVQGPARSASQSWAGHQ
jgi:hypothetical protein